MPTRISRDRALPLDLLADQAVHDLELSRIWHEDWVFAAPVDVVAEAGDFMPVTIGTQPVILVRGDDLQIRALANVCSHRGAPLVDEPGRGSRFPCPYHAWTYGTDGALQSVPYTLPDEIDQDSHQLESFRCETWNGLVFVSLNPDVESLADRLELVDPYVRPLAIDRLHHDSAGVAAEVWNANWKAVHTNALDSYSHFRVHAETIEPVSPTDGSYYLAGSARATVTGGESFERADHVVLALPPSFVAVIYPDAMLWQALTPVAVDKTQVRIGLAGEHSATSETSVPVNMPGWDAAFIDEDRAICEGLQRNARVRSRQGQLIDMERAIGDFHEYLRWRLTDVEPGPSHIAAMLGDRPDAP